MEIFVEYEEGRGAILHLVGAPAKTEVEVQFPHGDHQSLGRHRSPRPLCGKTDEEGRFQVKIPPSCTEEKWVRILLRGEHFFEQELFHLGGWKEE